MAGGRRNYRPGAPGRDSAGDDKGICNTDTLSPEAIADCERVRSAANAEYVARISSAYRQRA
jgi:hypothetical protein